MSRRAVAFAALLATLGFAACREPAPLAAPAEPTAEHVAGGNPASAHMSPAAADAASPTASPPLGQRQGKLRVMSWNLEWFFDDHLGDNFSQLAKQQSAPNRAAWNWKRDGVAKSLATARPDIAGLQEVEGRRALWYLTRALLRNHDAPYGELCLEGNDVFTEQDVGFLYHRGREGLVLTPLRQSLFSLSPAMIASDRYAELSKHLAVEFEIRLSEATERLTVMNVHLRAGTDARAIRVGQGRTVHAWLADKIAAGENVILLGDFNTDTRTATAPPGSALHAASGQETATAADDLVDLHRYLPADRRPTHLLPGRAMDRILVSQSLLVDDPERVDLSFDKIEQLKELSVRGRVDSPDDHFDRYWAIDPAERDLSDHWPIMATFQMR